MFSSSSCEDERASNSPLASRSSSVRSPWLWLNWMPKLTVPSSTAVQRNQSSSPGSMPRPGRSCREVPKSMAVVKSSLGSR